MSLSQGVCTSFDVCELNVPPLRALHDVENEMSKLVSRNPWKRIVNYGEDTVTITAFKERIENARRIIQMEIGIATLALVEDVNAVTSNTQAMLVDTSAITKATHTGVVSLVNRFEDEKTQRLLECIGTGSSAANAAGVEEHICTPGTREAVLARIKRWIMEPEYDKKHILWLKALAGSGKTTIAGSVEKMAKTSQCLGARFYFARGQPERNRRCVLEISRQLASVSRSSLQDSIVAAIQAEPDIATLPTAVQYQKLIQEPLLTLADTKVKLVIVIYAVDECEEDYAIKLLEHIGRDHHRLPTGIKFSATSRVEPHIQGELEEESIFSTVEHLSLDVEGSSAVQKDIALYLKGRLPVLVRRFGIRDKNWPGEVKRMELARMAGNSFIWAATVVLLVADPSYRNPAARLEHILSTPSLQNLDYLYSSALEHGFPPNIDHSVLSLLRDTLGMLVVARTPLNLTTLACLLSTVRESPQVMEQRIRNEVLIYLRSVVMFSDGDSAINEPVQFLHKSFVDFLVTKGRCDDRFLLIIPEQQQRMAFGCLRLMNDLKRNICQLTDPSKLNSEVDDMTDRIHRHIPHALQYACKHWADHLSAAPPGGGTRAEIDRLLEKFTSILTPCYSLSCVTQNASL
ncbi:hypothetical protein FRB95_003644 [Tulasnella sp. JGI-2019a]|nr:hypothetical protein FRB95_003644 [Tulasnella sp. JGI-2019a]